MLFVFFVGRHVPSRPKLRGASHTRALVHPSTPIIGVYNDVALAIILQVLNMLAVAGSTGRTCGQV